MTRKKKEESKWNELWFSWFIFSNLQRWRVSELEPLDSARLFLEIKSTLGCPYWASTLAKQQGWKPESRIQLIQRPCDPNLSVNKSGVQSSSAHRGSQARCCFHMDSQAGCRHWQHNKVKVLAAAEELTNRCDPSTRGKPPPDLILRSS